MVDRGLQSSARIHSTTDIFSSSAVVGPAQIISRAISTQESAAERGIVLNQGEIRAEGRGEDDGPSLALALLLPCRTCCCSCC